MYRNAEKDLITWHQGKRRKPLIIRGARQVGKSTLVRNFAKNNNLTLFEINLEKYPYLDKVFTTFNVDMILREISSVIKKDITPNNSMLFLDEIQATPHAIQALRYFYEDMPDLPVISAGSLLEFTLADHNFSMPVGRVEYLHLNPMSFEEFLIAKQELFLLNILSNYSLTDTITDSAHDELSKFIREYMIVGGMPEAVLAYMETKQFTPVYKVHDSIIATYQDDFGKYAKNKDLIRLHNLFNYAPRAVGQKIKYVNISREEQSREIKNAIDLLNKAKIIMKVYHSSCSGIPISADIDTNIYKLIFLDIGLMNRMCGVSWQDLSMSDGVRLINEGALAEQFIGQHLLLASKGYETPGLYYWLREKRSSNAEIDFVISLGKHIVPIEVKSGKSGTLKSLLQFASLKKTTHGIRFDLNKPSVQNIQHDLKQENDVAQVNYQLLSLPLYLVEQLTRLFESLA